MNQNEMENLAVEIIEDICLQEGEPTYVLDHNDLKDYFDGNVDDDVFAEVVELIPQVDIDKFNERLIPELEEAMVNAMVR